MYSSPGAHLVLDFMPTSLFFGVYSLFGIVAECNLDLKTDCGFVLAVIVRKSRHQQGFISDAK